VLLREKRDLAKAITCALRVASDVPEVGVTLLGLLERACRDPDSNHVPEMRQLYAVLSQNAETRLLALNNWGLTLAGQAKTKAGRKPTGCLRRRPQVRRGPHA